MTDHPLTETAAVELTMKFASSVVFQMVASVVPDDLTEYARAAFDAGREHERTNPDDDRPWEPLNGGRVYVGDEVRRDHSGITSIAVVGRVDKHRDPWTAEGGLIGPLGYGTWYVRRHIQELPTEPDSVIERAEGHKYITATVSGETYRAREAVLSGERWHAVWRRDSGRGAVSFVRPHEITPGTWKVEEK